MNSNLVFESRVISNVDSFGIYIKKEGYSLLACSNGDWNAQHVMVSGFARQNDSHLIHLATSISGSIRLNCLWVREDLLVNLYQ